MVAVMGVVLVLAILTSAIVSEAVTSREFSTQDRSRKAALGVAQAGLATATYRLNKLHPDASHCVTNQLSSPNDPSGDCVQTESVGNGGSFTFYMTTGGVSCESIPGRTDPTGVERCITSSGTVNGITRRIQARVVSAPATPPLLPVHGVTALNSFYEKNNAKGNADVGGNGTIEIDKNEMTGKWLLGPGATQIGEAPKGGTEKVPAFSLAPAPIAGVEGSNNDGVLTAAQGFKASDYSLTMTGDLTLPAGDYYFCHIDFGGHTVINTAGGTVRIFVDAPPAVRSGSKCPENSAGSGYYGSADGTNGVELNPNGNASNLQLYVYGWPPTGKYATEHGGVNTLYLKNKGVFTGMIYAPNTHVEFKNSGKITGGIAAYDVVMKNNTELWWDSSLSNVGEAAGAASGQGWFECSARPPVASNPQSGC